MFSRQPLQQMLEKYGVKMWNEFIYFKAQSNGRLCEFVEYT
jgi:hypothetical protein